MDPIRVTVKKIREGAILPRYGSARAAGADLYACTESDLILKPGETALIPTGLIVALPEGTVGLVYARSGLALREGLAPANKVGVIDCDYRGEVMVALYNHSAEPRTVSPGERIAQLVITPYLAGAFEEGDVDDTARGAGGFGSTGKR
ncbi:MAG: dUTP diphosphatase [Clostridia bacterium]|nr:dUTP diphosphatase [Clostridia bacterium]